MSPPIVLLTDFGWRDPFVGIMKGVIAGINPEAALIDLSHAIPPGDIQRGAISLWQSAPYFPKGTIFLCVIDPGVGTKRKAIILNAKGRSFVGPDNGVFSYLLEEGFEAWRLTNPDLALARPGRTFHGRDLFAPAAAHASRGIPGPQFGDPVAELVRLPDPILDSPAPGVLRGEILHADRFGNLLTSLGKFRQASQGLWQLQPWVQDTPLQPMELRAEHVQLPNGDTLAWVSTFAQVPRNQCAALVGSSGLIELVANQESAAELLKLERGQEISLFCHPS
jgi:S-adenosylmethionine hydrolase